MKPEPPGVLIACLGNIFLGDDGFGVEVARRLLARPPQKGVTVRDFGIRGIDLVYALADLHDLVILVDACPRGNTPGTVYVIQPDPSEMEGSGQAGLEGHSMNPTHVLRMARSMGYELPPLLIVGCEPEDVGSAEEGKLGLSPRVAAAVAPAVELIDELISKARGGGIAQDLATAALRSH